MNFTSFISNRKNATTYGESEPNSVLNVNSSAAYFSECSKTNGEQTVDLFNCTQSHIFDSKSNDLQSLTEPIEPLPMIPNDSTAAIVKMEMLDEEPLPNYSNNHQSSSLSVSLETQQIVNDIVDQHGVTVLYDNLPSSSSCQKTCFSTHSLLNRRKRKKRPKTCISAESKPKQRKNRHRNKRYCKLCDKVMSEDWLSHVAYKHLKASCLICDLCGYGVGWHLGNMQQHFRVSHPGSELKYTNRKEEYKEQIYEIGRAIIETVKV